MDARVVRVDGAEVHLTPHEYKLLQVLTKHPGKVLTHRQLLAEVWGPNQSTRRSTCASTSPSSAGNWRMDPARPKHLQTEPGVGYRLVVEL